MFAILPVIATVAAFVLVVIGVAKLGANAEETFGGVVIGLIGDSMLSVPAPRRRQEPDLPPFVFRDTPVRRTGVPSRSADRALEPRTA
jgi:hypothetical protein